MGDSPSSPESAHLKSENDGKSPPKTYLKMKKLILNLEMNKAVFWSKVFGSFGLLCSALYYFIFPTEHYLVLFLFIFAGLSVYLRINSGNEELRSKTIRLLQIISILSVISLGILLSFCS